MKMILCKNFCLDLFFYFVFCFVFVRYIHDTITALRSDSATKNVFYGLISTALALSSRSMFFSSWARVFSKFSLRRT